MSNKHICNFVFLTLLYSVFIVEFNYIYPGNHFGYPILSMGYSVGLLLLFFSKVSERLTLRIAAVLYAISVVFSCLIAGVDTSLYETFIDIIKNTEWVLIFSLAYILGRRYGKIGFISSLICYVILPALYVLYYLVLTRTFFIGEEEGYRDAIFPILVLTPFALLQDNKIKYVHVFISLTLVLISAKRSAIIAVVLAYAAYFIINMHGQGKSKLKSFFPFILIAGVLYYLFTKGLFSIGLERFHEMNYDSGSGRDIIYIPLLQSFQDSDLLQQLFGHGTASTKNIVYKLAHNDFLQVLYDYGLISFTFFAIVYFGFIYMAFKMGRRINDFRNEYSVYVYNLILFIVIGFLNCFVSSPHVFSVTILCFGFIIGRYYSLDKVY